MITGISFFALFFLAALSVDVVALDTLLFRLFLADDTSVVGYGELARVDENVVFSVVTGGNTEPRLCAAARAASVTTTWKASSSTSGTLLLLSHVRQEIRELLESPQLQ